MIGRLNHIAIAVPDLDKASELYRSVMGAKVSAPKAQPAPASVAANGWFRRYARPAFTSASRYWL